MYVRYLLVLMRDNLKRKESHLLFEQFPDREIVLSNTYTAHSLFIVQREWAGPHCEPLPTCKTSDNYLKCNTDTHAQGRFHDILVLRVIGLQDRVDSFQNRKRHTLKSTFGWRLPSCLPEAIYMEMSDLTFPSDTLKHIRIREGTVPLLKQIPHNKRWDAMGGAAQKIKTWDTHIILEALLQSHPFNGGPPSASHK